MSVQSVSKQTLQRLPQYLNFLKSMPRAGAANISATAIAEALGLGDVQVRKDLALVSSGGRPKVGYDADSLIADLERFLGYDDATSAVIVGAGDLGRALLGYHGFAAYGIEIVAAFDHDPARSGQTIHGKPVFPVERLQGLCKRMQIRIGIIAVPAGEAQTVCDALVEGGVRAVWNFAPVVLSTPESVLVQNEDIAVPLAVLSKRLTRKLAERE